MYRLSSIILLLWGILPLCAQSPHGEELKLDCALCHTSSGWEVDAESVNFDHSSTPFDLEGAHMGADCRLCHTTLVFDEAPLDCASCPLDVHSMLVGNDCVRCHNSQDWLVDNIPELHEENGFPLIGAHANLSCVECHQSETNLRFDRLGNECINCHREDYTSAQNPEHAIAGFSTNCTDCHSPLGFGWNADPIAHDFFPLTEGHDIANCAECHTTGNFADASPECIACHQADFQSTANPDHETLGFSTDCVSCHTTAVGWMPATLDNHNDFYALNGRHATIANDCFACHAGDYNTTPNTCIGCHQADYNDADDPDHAGNQFPNDCVICHSEEAWEPANFNHDAEYFPIFSGKHGGVWDDCAECHISAGNFAVFSCTTCHRQTPTANNHNGVSGYVYESNACLQCHPDGEE